MSDNTHIEWTDATWNPITGCSVVSPGCANCYAMRLAGTRLRDHPSRKGLTQQTKAGPVWTGEVRLNEEWLDQPLRWRRPRRIFVCAHGDLFHESVPDGWIDKVFAGMALAPQHTFQVLTKRPARMRAYLQTATLKQWANACVPGVMAVTQNYIYRAFGMASKFDYDPATPTLPLPNVHLGVSVEDQTRADERIPILLDTPAAVRWVSAEPLLGGLDLEAIRAPDDAAGKYAGHGYTFNALREVADGNLFDAPAHLDWIVVGGESGPDARPTHPDWVRQIRDDCAAAGVAFLFKQWGEWGPGEAAAAPPLRTEDVAWRWGDRWDFGSLTPRESSEMHTDDAPDVYRVGKRAAGRLLDGVLHDQYPEIRT